ncbi:MAG: cyclic-di-AMP receptor [Limnochordia bacterium]|jgi:uncharacterized protein YaaQ
MKLLLAIVDKSDVRSLREKLTAAGLRATILASTGGFISHGNTTILMGLNEDEVPRAMEIIKDSCQRRKRLVTFAPPDFPALTPPIEVESGGAIVFTLPVEDFAQF